MIGVDADAFHVPYIVQAASVGGKGAGSEKFVIALDADLLAGGIRTIINVVGDELHVIATAVLVGMFGILQVAGSPVIEEGPVPGVRPAGAQVGKGDNGIKDGGRLRRGAERG